MVLSARLLISDGSPQWWLSPAIWAVPGNDPNGNPGSPIAGQPAYLWARVTNLGDLPATGARIDYYWANPQMQISVGNVTQIGSAYVDVPAKGSQDVLCLVPWKPVIVNGGHECVLAVAHSQSEEPPLPDPLPLGFDFDPPSHDEIAQRNLSVVSAFAIPIILTITAGPRSEKDVLISTELGGELSEELLKELGLVGFEPAGAEFVKVALNRQPAQVSRWEEAPQELRISLRPGESAGVYVSIRADRLPPEVYQLVNIIEKANGRVLGGITLAAVKDKGGKK